MKKNISRIAIAASAIAAFVFAVYSCVTMDPLSFSANPAPANDEVIISGHINLNPKADQDGYFVAGFMLPDIIDPEDVTVTYTTTGMQASQGIADVTDSPMTYDPELVEVTTSTDYPTALYSKYGNEGNVRGGTSWLSFKGSVYYELVGNENNLVDCYVTIKVNLPNKNFKFNTALSATLSDTGFKTDSFGDYWGISDASMLEVSGGEGDCVDYRELPLCSTVPSEFRYGDFVSIQFTSEVGGNKTALYDMESVYLFGNAVLEDDSIVSVKEISDKRLMKRVDNVTYSKYILPVDYFGLKKGTKIKKLYFYFANYDASVIVCSASQPLGYSFEQCAE